MQNAGSTLAKLFCVVIIVFVCLGVFSVFLFSVVAADALRCVLHLFWSLPGSEMFVLMKSCLLHNGIL